MLTTVYDSLVESSPCKRKAYASNRHYHVFGFAQRMRTPGTFTAAQVEVAQKCHKEKGMPGGRNLSSSKRKERAKDFRGTALDVSSASSHTCHWSRVPHRRVRSYRRTPMNVRSTSAAFTVLKFSHACYEATSKSFLERFAQSRYNLLVSASV